MHFGQIVGITASATWVTAHLVFCERLRTRCFGKGRPSADSRYCLLAAQSRRCVTSGSVIEGPPRSGLERSVEVLRRYRWARDQVEFATNRLVCKLVVGGQYDNCGSIRRQDAPELFAEESVQRR